MAKKVMKSKGFSLLIFLAVVLLVEVAGGVFTETSLKDWYMSINKAPWNPPSWVFGPVWTILYIMIAVSGWLVYNSDAPRRKKRTALIVYGFQLFFNLIWTFFFFTLKNPILGAIDIIVLLIVIAINIRVFLPLSRAAAYLLIPYFIWVLYATTLNIAIVFMN